jgi:hypothetical protein
LLKSRSLKFLGLLILIVWLEIVGVGLKIQGSCKVQEFLAKINLAPSTLKFTALYPV